MCVCVGVAATSVQPKFGETTTSYLDESTSPADFGEIWTLSSVRREPTRADGETSTETCAHSLWSRTLTAGCGQR